MIKQALEGLKVLEYCDFVSGPYCSKLLGDMGAEVIKIEKPGLGDKARRRGPFLNNIPHPEKSGLFLYLNINKLGITLNPETHTGKKILKELVKETDVLIEDRSPKEMKDMGLDYESLREINPSLIMTSVTPFGQNGTHRDYKAYDINMYYGSGMIYKPLPPDDENHQPMKGAGHFGDYTSGLTAAMATLCAQYVRENTGGGQYIDISKQEALIALLRVTSVTYPNYGLSDFSLASIAGAMGGLQRCKDGYVMLTTAEEHQWQAFIKLMGDPEWAKDPDLQDIFSRANNYHKFEPYIKKWLMNHTKDEIYQGGQALGCPVATISTTEDIANSKQMKARDFFVEIEHKEAGRLKYPQAPYRFSKSPCVTHRPAPLLGEHNEEIYCKHLCYSKDDLVKLAESGII
ncbi:MAG: CoA transferase [Spirochaetota bacterium]|nr:CoA transferase [Spirochaetota bacterium]